MGLVCLLLHLAASSALAREPTMRRSPAPRGSPVSSPSAVPFKRGGVPSMAMAMGPLAKSAAIFGAANTLGFGVSVSTNWHYHLDLIGTGVFAVSALLVRAAGRAQQASACAVSLWALKLASFLFVRVLKLKRDARLEGLLATTSGAASFWFVSFLWGFVVSLPHTIAAGVPAAVQPALGPTSALGVAMFAAGLTLETAADAQKWMFKGDPANAGQFCNVGVWKLTQHPNWFGNLLLWTGILVINLPALVARTPGLPSWRRYWRLALAALSPLFLWKLFDAQASGSLESAAVAVAKYKDVPGYKEYVEMTPQLFPTFKSFWTFLTK